MRLRALSLLLCLSLTFSWGIECPPKEEQDPPKERQTLKTQIPSIVEIDLTCNRCTGFIVAPGKIITAAHCLDTPTEKIVAIFIDGSKSELKIEKIGIYTLDVDKDIAVLKGDTRGFAPLELLEGCQAKPEYAISIGYGGKEDYQKAVKAFGGQPAPSTSWAKGLWVFLGDIDHGDSGGPVCNRFGKVLGMQVRMDPYGRPAFFVIPSCKLLEFMK